MQAWLFLFYRALFAVLLQSRSVSLAGKLRSPSRKRFSIEHSKLGKCTAAAIDQRMPYNFCLIMGLIIFFNAKTLSSIHLGVRSARIHADQANGIRHVFWLDGLIQRREV